MQFRHTTLLIAVLIAASCAHAESEPVIGLITKTETNPFFVTMKEGATEAARSHGAKLLSGAGKAETGRRPQCGNSALCRCGVELFEQWMGAGRCHTQNASAPRQE